MTKRLLIVLTGIDGSGKTTQARMLLENFNRDGIEALYVWSRWEPFIIRPFIRVWKKNLKKEGAEQNSSDGYDKMKGGKRRLLENPVFRWLWLAAFFIDYGFQIFVKIRLNLIVNKLVVSDRIFYDSIIDQAINLDTKKDWLIKSMNSFWFEILFPKPDLVLFIDCPGEIAFNRKEDAPNVEYLEDRRKLYLKLSEEQGWIRLDGTLSENEIAGRIRDIVYQIVRR